jgi:hypothetical protein
MTDVNIGRRFQEKTHFMTDWLNRLPLFSWTLTFELIEARSALVRISSNSRQKECLLNVDAEIRLQERKRAYYILEIVSNCIPCYPTGVGLGVGVF